MKKKILFLTNDISQNIHMIFNVYKTFVTLWYLFNEYNLKFLKFWLKYEMRKLTKDTKLFKSYAWFKNFIKQTVHFVIFFTSICLVIQCKTNCNGKMPEK